jgi:hypothetical protein
VGVRTIRACFPAAIAAAVVLALLTLTVWLVFIYTVPMPSGGGAID